MKAVFDNLHRVLIWQVQAVDGLQQSVHNSLRPGSGGESHRHLSLNPGPTPQGSSPIHGLESSSSLGHFAHTASQFLPEHSHLSPLAFACQVCLFVNAQIEQGGLLEKEMMSHVSQVAHSTVSFCSSSLYLLAFICVPRFASMRTHLSTCM